MSIAPVPTFSDEPGASVPADLIPLSVPDIAGNEWTYVKECLDTGWVSSVGSFVDRFERAVASYTDVPYAVATMNGTAALHTALLTIGLQPDEEVIVSTLTFIAPVNAIRYCGAHPVFMDAHPDTWQMDAAKLRQFLADECEMRSGVCYNRRSGRRVRAVLPVHLLGLACEIDHIVDSARTHGLAVVEDAAEGMGVRYRGRHIGVHGDIAAFSFNGNKIITCGGGGMVVTADPRHAEYARYLTTQAKDGGLEYVHNEVGYNYRLTNIQAALGLGQIERLDDLVARRRAIARAYRDAFADLDDITRMPTPPGVDATYWLYTILLRPGTTRDVRTSVIRRLHAGGVGARPTWYPVHALPPYRDCQAFEIEHAATIHARAVSLPSSSTLGEADLQRCISAVREAVAQPVA